MKKSLIEATKHGTDKERLEAQLLSLAEAIEYCESSNALASLHKQYRETMNQLADMEDMEDIDEIGFIKSGKQPVPGKSSRTRKQDV